MRANLLDELNKPYVVTARAKGMTEWRLVLKYPVRLAFNPLISTIGWYLPQLFSGSLIVATVMNLPNIGPLLLRALVNQDMYLAGSILLIYSFLTIVGTLVSDILLALFDPRIRMEGLDGRPSDAPPASRPKTASPSRRTGSWSGGASATTTSPWRARVAADLLLPRRAGAGLLRHPGPRAHRRRARPSSRCRRCISSTTAGLLRRCRRSSASAIRSRCAWNG